MSKAYSLKQVWPRGRLRSTSGGEPPLRAAISPRLSSLVPRTLYRVAKEVRREEAAWIGGTFSSPRALRGQACFMLIF